MLSRAASLLIAGLVASPPLALGAQEITFSGASIHSVVGGESSNPRGVATADLNRDGYTDIVTANIFSAAVTVLLGEGNGSFGSPSAYPAGEGPRQVAIGDLDLDGLPDLAVAGHAGVAVLPGHGDGSFGAATIYDVGRAVFVGIVDIDRNGRPDLVTVNYGEGKIDLLLGPEDLGSFPAFTQGPSYELDDFVNDAALADVNRDGEQDLLVLTEADLVVARAIPGSFEIQGPIHYCCGGDILAVGDLNRDGDPDVAIADFLGDSVYVLLGGSGTSVEIVAALDVDEPLDLAIADLNGDARGEVVAVRRSLISSAYRPFADVFEGDGSGGFGPPQAWSLGFSPTGEDFLPVDVHLAHLDRDAKIDLVTANWGVDSVSVLHNTTDFAPAGGFGTRVRVGSPEPGLKKLQVGDLNRDGKLDVAALDYRRIVTYLGNGDGSFHSAPLLSPSVSEGWLNRFELGDLNRDGRPDAVASYVAEYLQDDDNVAVFLTGSGGALGSPSLYEVGRNPVDVHLSDVDRNGFLDALVATPGDPSHDLSVRYGPDFTSHGTFAGCAARTNVVELATGDMDQDGKPDAVIGKGAGSPTIEVLRGDGSGGFTCAFSEDVLGEPPFFIGGLQVADLLRDSALDVSAIVHTYVNDPLTETRGYLWAGMGVGEGETALGAYRLFCPTSADLCPTYYELRYFVDGLLRTEGSVQYADLDRDGILDMVLPMDAKLWPPAEYDPARILLLRGTGGGLFDADATALTFEVSADSPQVGDFDRDGRLDIVTIDDDQIYLLLNGPGNATPPGSGVSVQPVDPVSGLAPVLLTFANVTQGGETTVEGHDSCPGGPAGYRATSPPRCFEVDTTAAIEGETEVCLDVSGSGFIDPSAARVFHFEDIDDDGSPDAWVDRTQRFDADREEVCGAVSSLSLFALFERQGSAVPGSEDGSIEAEVAHLRSLIFPRDSGLYVTPSAQDRADFGALARSLVAGDLGDAATWAAALGYEVILFEDGVKTYHVVREQPGPGGAQQLGWGSFVYDPDGIDFLIEVPHPLFETNTPDLGLETFVAAGARGFLLAGAHRAAQGDGVNGIANVASHVDSIFHAVHRAWSGPETVPVQFHGFALANHADFPAGTDVVLSNGDGAISQVHTVLDAAFDTRELLSFLYNTLPPGSPANPPVNTDWLNGGVVPGSVFASLAATLNVQGQYTRQIHGEPFLHVELEQSIRFRDPSLRPLAVEALVGAIQAHASGYSDTDGDGILDDGDASGDAGDAPCVGGQVLGCDDNCAGVWNSDQADGGGVGAGSAPDGVGDVCQCGDVNRDTRVTATDATILFNEARGNPTGALLGPELADVNGNGICTTGDATILFNFLRGVPGAFIPDRCHNEALTCP